MTPLPHSNIPTCGSPRTYTGTSSTGHADSETRTSPTTHTIQYGLDSHQRWHIGTVCRRQVKPAAKGRVLGIIFTPPKKKPQYLPPPQSYAIAVIFSTDRDPILQTKRRFVRACRSRVSVPSCHTPSEWKPGWQSGKRGCCVARVDRDGAVSLLYGSVHLRWVGW